MVTILSLLPVPSNPQTITELSGIAGSGSAAFVSEGTLLAPVEKVRTPVEETLYWLTALPLKLNGNPIFSTVDQVGLELLGPNMTVQPAGRPEPLGYSLSLFSPPGFPGVDEGK